MTGKIFAKKQAFDDGEAGLTNVACLTALVWISDDGND